MTLSQNSARISGIRFSACSRPALLRAMPQSSHMILPSSLWKWSTVWPALPSLVFFSSLAVWSLTAEAAASKAGSLVLVGTGGTVAR